LLSSFWHMFYKDVLIIFLNEKQLSLPASTEVPPKGY